MDIREMHVMFRQYAQQMGMQNVRAILPEQIDLLINTSIIDTTNELIRSSVGITNDRIITDNSKISQINSLRPLYKVKDIDCFTSLGETYFEIAISIDDIVNNGGEAQVTIGFETGKYLFQDIELDFDSITDDTHLEDFINNALANNKVLGNWNIKSMNYRFDTTTQESTNLHWIVFETVIDEYEIDALEYATVSHCYAENQIVRISATSLNMKIIKNLPFDFNVENFFNGKLTAHSEYPFPKFMFLVDFSISYTTAKKGYKDGNVGFAEKEDDEESKFVTNLYPVRLIDQAFLADTLQDFVLKNRLRSPVIVVYDKNDKFYFELYIDEFKKEGSSYYLFNKLLPYKFRIAYIAKPAIVKYVSDLNADSVDCNLPEMLHEEIVKHAVDLYRNALAGGLSSARAQQQNQQQEDARNNYRQE